VEITGVEVLKARGYGMKLQVDTRATSIEAVVGQIMSRYHVADINIADPPMESIIATIYRENRPAAETGGQTSGASGEGATGETPDDPSREATASA